MVHKALAFIRLDWQTQVSYRLHFLMRVAGVLVSVSTFYFVSSMLGSAVSPYLQYGSPDQAQSLDYFDFVLIGLAFYPFIDLSANGMAEVVQEYQHRGTLEMLFLSPTPILSSLVMSTLWYYCWAVVESLFYLVAARLLFGADLVWINLLSVALVLVLSVLAHTGLGLINAGFVLVTKRSSPLSELLTLVTTLLAGVYYPVEVLPDWMRFMSRLLPATYAFEALRHAMLQDASLVEMGRSMLALACFAAVLLPIGLVSLRYAVRWARADGSLAQY